MVLRLPFFFYLLLALPATVAVEKGIVSLDEYSFDGVLSSTSAAMLVKFDTRFSFKNDWVTSCVVSGVAVTIVVEFTLWLQFVRLAQEVAEEHVPLLMAQVEVGTLAPAPLLPQIFCIRWQIEDFDWTDSYGRKGTSTHQWNVKLAERYGVGKDEYPSFRLFKNHSSWRRFKGKQ